MRKLTQREIAILAIIGALMGFINLGINLAYGELEYHKFSPWERSGHPMVDMEMDLVQIPNIADWQKYNFEIRGYAVNISGQNVSIVKDDIHNNRIVVSQDQVDLGHMGRLENKTIEDTGTIKTKYLDVSAAGSIYEVREEPSISQTSYIFKSKVGAIIGDQYYDDAGGILIMIPSFEDPNVMEAHLWFSAGYPESEE